MRDIILICVILLIDELIIIIIRVSLAQFFWKLSWCLLRSKWNPTCWLTLGTMMNYFLMMLIRQQLTMKHRMCQNFQAMMMLMTVMRISFLISLLMWLFLMAVKPLMMTPDRIMMMVILRSLMMPMLLAMNLLFLLLLLMVML